MVDLEALVAAVVSTLRDIPELCAELAHQDPQNIVSYDDLLPAQNQLAGYVYRMAKGQVLVAWLDSTVNEEYENQSYWIHRIQFATRPAEDCSALRLVKQLVDGVPASGSGLRWRMCGVMDGILPVKLSPAERVSDAEQIDYYSVIAEFKETGDA